jgi:hypothetical protein
VCAFYACVSERASQLGCIAHFGLSACSRSKAGFPLSLDVMCFVFCACGSVRIVHALFSKLENEHVSSLLSVSMFRELGKIKNKKKTEPAVCI